MKISKTQFKQIILEELQAVLREGMVDGEGKPPPGPWYEKGKVYELEEAGDVYGHFATEDDPRGTSAPLTTDAPGMTGVGDAESAMKSLNQAELLISQAVDFFKQEGRIDQGVIQSLENMAADLRRY